MLFAREISFDQKQAVLRKFVDQGFFENDIAAQLENNRISFDLLCGFRLLWFQMDHTIGYWESYELKERRLLGFRLVNEINNAVPQELRHETLEVNSAAYVLILNQPCHKPEDIGKAVMQRLKTVSGISFSCVVGEPVDDYEDLPMSYGRCRNAIRYRLLTGCESVIGESTIRELEKGNSALPMEKIQRIEDLLLLCKADEAEKAYAELADELVKGTYSRFQGSMFMLSNSIRTLICAHPEALGSLHALNLPVTETTPDCYDSMEQIRDVYSDVFRKICASLSEYNRSREAAKRYPGLSEAVDRYLEEAYTDYRLNSDMIAEQFSMSAAYLRRLYKRETGSTLNEVLMRLRLSRVCAYLETTDMPLGEIAMKCGLLNVNYLYGVFRNMYGLTPNEYRKLNGRKG